MIFAFVIAGRFLFLLLQKLMYKMSPKLGWVLFLSGYLFLSAVCVFSFIHVLDKFTLWQRIGVWVSFTLGTALRILYYRGRMLPYKI